MSFRDDLAAAHARIQQLEQELARLRAEGEKRDSPKNMAEQIAALRDQLAELKRGYSEKQKASRERELELNKQLKASHNALAGTKGRGIATLTEHNRSFPPITGHSGAGVKCPMCAAVDEDVEMTRGAPFLTKLWWVADGGRSLSSRKPAEVDLKLIAVVCPRCAFASQMREQPR